jgi:hypothetical protein
LIPLIPPLPLPLDFNCGLFKPEGPPPAPAFNPSRRLCVAPEAGFFSTFLAGFFFFPPAVEELEEAAEAMEASDMLARASSRSSLK